MTRKPNFIMHQVQSIPRVSHLLISLSLLLFCLFTLTISKQCNPYDENILLELKTQLGNPSTLVQHWTPTTDCCTDWQGSFIKCDGEGHVTMLVLGLDDDVSGPIPSIIGQLYFLQVLELWNKNISGSIPHAVCNLTRLEFLAIQSTSMSGPIPSCLGRLTNLVQLEIILNHLIMGPIPDSLGNLTKVVSLQLQGNNLSGPIPDSLHQLTSLETLSVISNQLSGSIPPSLGLNPNLSTIYLANNRLSGLIPESFSLLKSKDPVFLDLHGNRLTGPIPKSLGQANITFMDLSNNRFSGEPSFLAGRNKTFVSVNLSKNRFKFDFSKVQLPMGLRSLDISHNMIYGSLPKQLGQLPLYNIDVSYNQLCGPIPTGRRLKRFDPSLFSHNKCLCGLPLPPCK